MEWYVLQQIITGKNWLGTFNKIGVMKKIGALFFLLPVIMLSCSRLWAQDHMYTQFFNSPIYLNPALTGQFEGDLRMNLIYRNQFTSVPGSFNYLSGSIDYRSE